ncbi:transcription antitermination factor NusB [soil metagenome]
MSAEPRGHEAEQEGRRLALGAIFEAEFGQRTARRALDRRLEEDGTEPAAAALAGAIVDAVVSHRDTIDALITRVAPQYPVTQLARIDRALLRSALGELLHCPTTPTRVAIAEWVELARTYSGEPARRLLNGVLGRVASEATSRGRELSASDNENEGGGADRHTGGST